MFERLKELMTIARDNNIRIVTAESCTGGLVASALTELPGSSAVFDRGFITYSDDAKETMLNVPKTLLGAKGAVSEEVAIAMAEGALENSPAAGLSVSVTGIAGPDGGTPEKPVGLVYIASSRTGEETVCDRFQFEGDRESIREQTVEAALTMIMDRID